MARLVHHSDLEGVYDTPARAARLAGRVRALDGPDALVCGTGDDLAPGVLALLERGAQALPLFEAAGTAFETFGNHDFDFGTERALELAAASTPTWLTVNVSRAGGADLGADGVRATALREVAGSRVGLFGVTTPLTAETGDRVADLAFDDPVAAGAAAADALRDRGADRVVALSHLGRGDAELARGADVDVVLGGHRHAARIDRIDGSLLTRPGAGGRAVVEVDLDDLTATRHPVEGAPAVAAVAEALRGRTATAGLDRTVARVETPVARDDAVTFGGECRVGNFVADAYRAAVDADVGLANAGGIRDGPALSGAVSRADVLGLVPFEEPLVVAEVSGARLRTALSEGAGRDPAAEPTRWHAHLSGASVRADPTTGTVTALRVGGEPVDDDARYEVALADYLLGTDVEFPALGDRHRTREGPVQHEALLAHAAAGGLDVGIEGRVRLSPSAGATTEGSR
jgi:2',3'-cyclic-nucleotide 2'-phosphodiesterase (5'-nucleotidase family)